MEPARKSWREDSALLDVPDRPSAQVLKHSRSSIAHSIALRDVGAEEKTESPDVFAQARFAIRASLVVNVVLAVGKTYAAIASGSLAVLSSLVDSILDLVAQGLFYYSDKHIHTPNSKYPAGRQRLEPIAVIVSATLMGMAAVEVIQQSLEALVAGLRGSIPSVDVSLITLAVLVFVVVVKIGLWVLCARIGKYSASAKALAQDHRNDVYSNIVAIVTCMLAHWKGSLWYTDPSGAIAISIYIASSWLVTGKEQVERLVGLEASPEFIDEVQELASAHHPLLELDSIRAYHFGNNYIVELEVVLPPTMNVSEAHDISLELQRSVEAKPCVERAFVHVDYRARDYDEHKDPTHR